MRRRLSARLLILDEADRILLFRFVYKRGPLAGQDFWGTPGGGVEDGETWSRRPCASWSRKPACGGRVSVQRSPAARSRCSCPTASMSCRTSATSWSGSADNALSRDDWTDLEREVMVEHRWWSLEDLSRTEATVWPENLREMIEAALR